MHANSKGIWSGEADRPEGAPEWLLKDPHRFWSVGPGFEGLAIPEEEPAHSILERLGPLPLPRSGFPLVGFLATVYDHIAVHTRRSG